MSSRHWDDSLGKCVDDVVTPPSHECPAGQHWDEAQQKCVPDKPTPEGLIYDIVVLSVHYNKECILILPTMNPFCPFPLVFTRINFWRLCQIVELCLNVLFCLFVFAFVAIMIPLFQFYYGS